MIPSIINGLSYVVPFVAILTVLVFVHEMGHYLVARRNGVRVEVFSIGFGPELFGWFDKSGTRWKVSALPLGGYVKMFGESAATDDEEAPELTPAEQAVSFQHKRLSQRAAIVAAGPIANFVFAIVVLAVVYGTVGRPYSLPQIGSVQPDSAAAVAGLVKDDMILRIDERQIERFEDIQEVVRASAGKALHIQLRRGETELTVTATPRLREITDNFGQKHEIGLLGVTPAGTGYLRQNPAMAGIDAVKATFSISGTILHAVGEMIAGSRAREELGGPLRIAQMSGQVAQGGLLDLILFTAMLSINLGLINLFPVPLLDGGHLVFYGAEAIRGKPLGPRTQEYSFRIGAFLVLSLLVFATWNDLVHLKVWDFVKGFLG